jgi:hypothetical protein
VVSTAVVSTREQRHWADKLDTPLVHAAKQGGAGLVSAAIRLRPGTADQFVAHLSDHGLKPTIVTRELVAVEMPAAMLRSVALDHDVVHISVP